MRDTHASAVLHKGALSRSEDSFLAAYSIDIYVPETSSMHTLELTRHDWEFAQRVFAILDSESRGSIERDAIREFVILRCPVFWRRDDDLRRLGLSHSSSPTFDEIWQSVAKCSTTTTMPQDKSQMDDCQLGVEGWIVFCRFIALAQYLEAKRRFSARHLQQTMRHRNSPQGSEVVVVDVPPLEPPAPLTPEQLAAYEQKNQSTLPVPELDLDHSLVAAHDTAKRHPVVGARGIVKISLFGASFASNSSTANLEFALSYFKSFEVEEPIVVRRSMADMKWLDDTFTSHRVSGGTLCGRILPPFPGSDGGMLSAHFPSEETVLKTTNGAIAVATAGVGRIREAAKSWFGTYGSIDSQESQKAKNTATRKKSHLSFALPEQYYNPNSPEAKARHLERYLNYLLEHPALSTSFPLNTILQSSQSGLEAAKLSLAECTKTTKEIRDQTPKLDDTKSTLSFWSTSGPSNYPNLPWVRTAAQAAMALKVHGMLETTGLQSASARLQQASLPSFGSSRPSGWDDEDNAIGVSETMSSKVSHSAPEGNNFEEGVVTVDSQLVSEEHAQCDDGYDLLPLPVPAPERRILSAGSGVQASTELPREERFHYGSPCVEGRLVITDDENRSAFLGDISVDENIDKLREVIASVDNTLSRCLASCGSVGKARRDRQRLHLDIVRGLDAWEGMRGMFVSQRALMKGVSGLNHSNDVFGESDLQLIDDISWQTGLARAAVSSAEDVRSAVRVARTASNARAAASSAAMTAQSSCESGNFVNIDEARAAQTRASIAQSHAMRAAVVEHEARTVKRRVTLALAHDVKCWNVHRKRELLVACIGHARSQHEATRRAVDAWSSLRDGFIGAAVVPSTYEKRSTNIVPRSEDLERPLPDQDEAIATIYGDSMNDPLAQPSIVAIDHVVLSSSPTREELTEKSVEIGQPESDLFLPFATADPIPEEDDEDFTSRSSVEHTEKITTDDMLSASMQSLVNGLMSWGGGFEAEEEHFALPSGMAASIAFEECDLLGDAKAKIA